MGALWMEKGRERCGGEEERKKEEHLVWKEGGSCDHPFYLLYAVTCTTPSCI
jgi:hypothetical protein